jgi:hypothetical protein
MKWVVTALNDDRPELNLNACVDFPKVPTVPSDKRLQ